MLDLILNYQLIYIGIGVAGAIGVLSKCIAQITLKRLVKAASNMNKSTHSLMRLVRAKFEHACMVSDKVENVQAFVEKYLYEYKILGMTLHTWQRMEIKAVWFSLVIGAVGAGASYYINGMQDQVIQYGAMGAAGAVLLYIIHKATDESYRTSVAKTYMVDYLENVCAHRYAKAYRASERQKEAIEVEESIEANDLEESLQNMEQEEKKEEVPILHQEPIREPEQKPVIQEPEPKVIPPEEPEPERIPREVIIREILEEFLA